MKPTQPLKRFQHFATQHPLAFGLVLFFLFTLLSTLTWPISQQFPFPEGSELGKALAKIVMTACFVGVLWRFGWLESAGYCHLGSRRLWLVVIPLVLYKAFLGVYVFSGAIVFPFPPLPVTLGIVVFSLTTALLEESMYRGLLLTAMLKAWGHTRRGVLLSALVSGLFWAFLHLFNLIIRPWPVVFSQVLSITLVGFYYGVIAIASRSIWPAVLFHWVTNSVITLALRPIPDFEEAIPHWVGYTLISLLPVLVSLWLLRPGLNRTAASKAQQIPL
jgi:membrane protease YdiL (CAAX protease family)